mgnify:CR=1 FL=1
MDQVWVTGKVSLIDSRGFLREGVSWDAEHAQMHPIRTVLTGRGFLGMTNKTKQFKM